LTILSAFRKVLPNEDIIFFGDTKNMPYGEKSKEQLIEYSNKAFQFFENRGVKAVVMACNTTSATVYEELKDKYNFKLYPLIQSVSKIISELNADTIGVFATPATINSHAYKANINKYNPKMSVIEISCPMWVKFVEDNLVNTEIAKVSVREKMQEISAYKPEKIVLGCTHYPYLTEEISKYISRENIINPAEYYAYFIKNDLSNLQLLSNKTEKGSDSFYVSSSPDKFIRAASMFYNVEKCMLIEQ
jgi:glutamate racemase